VSAGGGPASCKSDEKEREAYAFSEKKKKKGGATYLSDDGKKGKKTWDSIGTLSTKKEKKKKRVKRPSPFLTQENGGPSRDGAEKREGYYLREKRKKGKCICFPTAKGVSRFAEAMPGEHRNIIF